MTDGPATPQDASTPSEPSAPQQQPAPQASPAARPRPTYGELAPEGWEWKPEDTPATEASPAPQVHAASGAGPIGQAAPATPTLSGVPHNLGAGLPKRGAKAHAGGRAGAAGSGSGTTQAPPAHPGAHGTDTQGSGTPGAPYRAQAPGTPAAAPGTPAPQPVGAPRPRIADRVITIGLLVLGAFTTLSLSSALFALESQIRLTATMIGVEDAKLAPWIGPLGTITGIVVLALFAVTLIFSIQRMRAGKLAFWVPLTAGVIAVLLVLIVPTVAMLAGAPEILHQLEADPNGSLDKMFEYMQQMQP